MINIVNMGPHDKNDPMGWRTYKISINSYVITTFQHKRSDGLEVCLLKAAKAVERQKLEDVANMVRKIREEG